MKCNVTCERVLLFPASLCYAPGEVYLSVMIYNKNCFYWRFIYTNCERASVYLWNMTRMVARYSKSSPCRRGGFLPRSACVLSLSARAPGVVQRGECEGESEQPISSAFIHLCNGLYTVAGPNCNPAVFVARPRACNVQRSCLGSFQKLRMLIQTYNKI